MSNKSIVIIAGEASGDQHAAHLVHELQNKCPNLQFSGIGGAKMQEAGVTLIENISRLNVMGFTEVIRHIKEIREVFKTIERYLLKTKPNLLILVDYPGFNLRLAKKAKAMGIKVLHYISPQLWAWKPGRIKTIKENIDSMAVILPFEKKIYEDAGVPVHFVGHPLSETVKTTLSEVEIREKLKLPLNKKIIGILPGSRKGEIKRIFPTMLKAAEMLYKAYPELEFILPVAPTLSEEYLKSFSPNSTVPIHYISSPADHYDLVNTCHSLMITSGTATLEAALLTKPLALCYKTSQINYTIATQVIRIKYIGLCNILADKMAVPEIIQNDLTPQNLFLAMQRFIEDTDYYNKTQQQLQLIKDSLNKNPLDKSLADVVLTLIGE